jgi:hypothetical protein
MQICIMGPNSAESFERFYILSIDFADLYTQNKEQQMYYPRDDCICLAKGIASNYLWAEIPDVKLIVRATHHPAMAIFGSFDNAQANRLKALARQLNSSCKNFRYVSYMQAEDDCRILAEKLINFFGRDELGKIHFAAIPRGGMIVLGMLSYVLGLDRKQLSHPTSDNNPLVVVDDCSLTGKRFADFIENCQSDKIIFATLYSHPYLRSAIEDKERRVMACLSAHDLHDN